MAKSPPNSLRTIVVNNNNQLLAETNDVGLNEIEDNDVRNKLSHLDIDCGNGAQYVMHPAIGASPNPFSKPRRTITQAEQEILCNIGYPDAGGCTNCVIIAEDDLIAQPIFLTGTPTINPIWVSIPGTLLSNDVVPSNYTVELCGASPGIQVVQTGGTGTNFIVTGLIPGTWTFCYRIRSTLCPEVCDDATVKILVLQSAVSTFCTPGDCNLVCFGDFEDFQPGYSLYGPQLNIPNYVIGGAGNDNSMDIGVDNNDDTQILRWYRCENLGINWECPRIPLSAPIMPGCEVTIRFKAAFSGPPSSDCVSVLLPSVPLGFYGITGPPCPVVNEPSCLAGAGGQFTLCSGVEAICLGSQEIAPDEDVSLLTSTPPTYNDLDLTEYEITFTVPNSFPGGITDLLIYGNEDYDYYLDNLSVTSSCNTQVSITPTVIKQCANGEAIIEYFICLTGNGNTPIPLTLQPQIPQGLQVVPGGGFGINGEASLQLTPGPLCSPGSPNTAVVTLTLTVGPLDLSNGPVMVTLPIQLSNGICINPGVSENGDVTLLLQDCTPAAACHCPPNTGIEIGMNDDSQTSAVMSGLPDEFTNTCITVNGKLVVDKNMRFSGCNIIMNKGAEIVVKGKSSLDLFSNIIEGCEHMWRSITVFGALHGEQNTVRDAQWGVRAQNKSHIWLTDNVFEQDYVALYVPDAPNGINVVHTLRIMQNEVTCAKLLKPAYGPASPSNPNGQWPAPGEYTFAGVYLNDVSGFDISLNNVFDGIRNGVVADNSTFTMSQCTVRNLVNYIYPINQAPGGAFNYCLYGVRATDCAGASITNCKMSGVHQGVRAERSNIKVSDNNVINADYLLNFSDPDESFAAAIKADFGANRSATITGNTLTSCGDGISLYQWHPAANLLVSANEISLTTCNASFEFNGISMIFCEKGEVSDNTIKPQNPSTATGLFLGNCRNIFVNNNTLYDLAIGESGNNNINCYFLGNTAKSDIDHGSPAGSANLGFTNSFSDNPYCCNTVDGLSGNGFVFDGPSTGTGFTYSQIKSAVMGLLLTESADISPQTHAKNRWLAGNAGAFHQSDLQNFILQSLFTCEPVLIPPFATAADQPGMPGVPWFLPQALPPGPVQPLCVCPYPQGPGGGDLPRVTADGDYLAAIGGYQIGQYSSAYNWMTQQRLYERLQQAPQLANTSTYIAAFYQSSEASAIGQYGYIKKGIRDLIGRDDYSRYVIGQSIEQINALSEELRLLRQNLAATDLQQYIKAHQLNQEVGRYKSYLKAVEQQQADEIGALLTTNIGLSASSIPQANEKVVNRVILENQIWKSSSMAAADITALNLIAAQCPLSGGFAVYEARGILTALGEGQNWEDGNLCTPVINRAGQDGEKALASGLFIYPNPANQSITVSGFVPNDLEKTFEIYTATGQKVVEVIVKRAKPRLTSALPAYAMAFIFIGQTHQTNQAR